MGLRIRRSIKIAPGVRLNIGKKGSSISVGRKGATVNLSNKGTRATVGIPGSGISYTETIGKRREETSQGSSEPSIGSKIIGWLVILFVIWVTYRIFV